MLIISLILIGFLTVVQFCGFYSCYKRIKSPAQKETKEVEQYYHSIGYFSSCVTFVMYFVGLFISSFVIESKIAVLLIVIFIISEFVLLSVRFKKVNESVDYEDMNNRLSSEITEWRYLIPEIIKAIFLIFLFVELALQL